MRDVRRVAILALAIGLTACACVQVQSGYALGPENNGATTTVPVGSELRLTLPAEYDWKVESTNTSALALKSTLIGSVGGVAMRIWLFDVKSAGQFVLRATGEPPCRKSAPPCATPDVSYLFNIRAQ